MPVPALDLSWEDLDRLGRLAGLLSGVGHIDSVDPAIALLCMAAAEDLRRRLGVDVSLAVIDLARIGEALDEALAGLAALPEHVFAATAVLDAAADTRAARALLTRAR